MSQHESDGLTKYDRCRLKDVASYRAKKAEWARTEEQRRKRTEYMRGWRERNRAKHNEQAKQSHHRNKHKHVDANRNRNLMASVGITLAEKLEMVEAQNGRCLICRESFPSSRSTHVDHCHTTKTIRGILCHRCNTKLGWFERYACEIADYLRIGIRQIKCGEGVYGAS